MVPQHGSFSLHTILEDPGLYKMAFPTSTVQPLDESQGSSPSQGHGYWLMCEAALTVCPNTSQALVFTTFRRQ